MTDNPEYAQWDRGNMRGVAKRRRFVGEDIDPATGKKVNVYEIIDDEWGDNAKIETDTESWPTDLSRWSRS